MLTKSEKAAAPGSSQVGPRLLEACQVHQSFLFPAIAQRGWHRRSSHTVRFGTRLGRHMILQDGKKRTPYSKKGTGCLARPRPVSFGFIEHWQ